METQETLANYQRGIDTGVMKSATPNVVRGLLQHIRELELELERLRTQLVAAEASSPSEAKT